VAALEAMALVKQSFGQQQQMPSTSSASHEQELEMIKLKNELADKHARNLELELALLKAKATMQAQQAYRRSRTLRKSVGLCILTCLKVVIVLFFLKMCNRIHENKSGSEHVSCFHDHWLE
jgi:hypothetical protein